MFEVTSEKINTEKSVDERAGGVVVFEGLVRNHNLDKAVTSLEYQCYEAMVIKEANLIMNEAREKFDVYDLKCVHRVGHLAIGDMAVWVYAACAHRQEAFEACQYIIDEVKFRLPIWKKEHYIDGPSDWIACHRCGEYGQRKTHDHKHDQTCEHGA